MKDLLHKDFAFYQPKALDRSCQNSHERLVAQDCSENKITATVKKMGRRVASQDTYFLESYHFLINHRWSAGHNLTLHMAWKQYVFFNGTEFKWVGIGTGEILSHRARAEVALLLWYFPDMLLNIPLHLPFFDVISSLIFTSFEHGFK